MKIIPIAGETLGIRSTSIFVETKDLKILIDPGFSIPILKNSFPPTPFEFRASDLTKKKIFYYSNIVDLIIITHYHMDHFSFDENIYKNKKVFIKDPENFISQNQKERAKKLISILEKSSINFYIAKGEHLFNKTKIKFSQEFPHGVDEKMGGVVSVLIEDDEKLIYSSDISGFSSLDSEAFVIQENPNFLIFDGPVLETLESAILSTEKILKNTDTKIFIMEHHPYRDLNFNKTLKDYFSLFEKGKVNLYNYASYLGVEENLLEAERGFFYEDPFRFNRKLW